MEIDLEKIREYAKARKEENGQFKASLRSIPTQQVDRLVQQLNEKISAHIDCTACGNCCKQLEPPLDTAETERLAKLKKISLLAFKEDYVAKEADTNIHFLKCQPCIFLAENTCSIYSQRPASCADYPHLHQPNFKYRWKSIMANYALCPIVYNVVEKLKEELLFVRNNA